MAASVCWMSKVEVVTDADKLMRTLYDTPSLISKERLRISVKRDLGYKKLVKVEFIGTPIDGVRDAELILSADKLLIDAGDVRLSILKYGDEIEAFSILVEAEIPEENGLWKIPPLEFREKIGELTSWIAELVRETALLLG